MSSYYNVVMLFYFIFYMKSDIRPGNRQLDSNQSIQNEYIDMTFTIP